MQSETTDGEALGADGYCCRGCENKSKKCEEHTFDTFCLVTCPKCKNASSILHSTYTRRNCLPHTRMTTNKTKMKDWAFKRFISKLDELGSSYEAQGNILKIQGNFSSYLAKFVLCSAPYEEVHVERKGKTRKFFSTNLSKQFSMVSNYKNVETAILNCGVI